MNVSTLFGIKVSFLLKEINLDVLIGLSLNYVLIFNYLVESFPNLY
jgi:hypothetical protein